ncbi:MAG TPA: nitrate reductase subunit beta [Solirubrobacteraceae bacterium]|jgi:nitrate reductase beta subunit|nr:nitrate reductase subunit beta [Solirubrobacteraceae bacterium]
MKVRAQVAMVMNLDKCIGCHTCSVTCNNVWTNRPGAEYMWFNNVETKPGIGYPQRWEDQEQWKGGWKLDRKGRLKLKAGGPAQKLANLFFNPNLPDMDDYYEPWTYDYENLTSAKPSEHQPVAQPISQVTGDPIGLKWGPNWEDDLAGGPDSLQRDPNIVAMEEEVKANYEQVFMMYLPRICEHCLNPSCVASCPSGAMYKREEDGIVLVDQEKCRGWRMCVSGCPYKKVYFNWKSGKAEKCTMCYPRIEAGLPTVCSETCVGRLRYLGLVLYDADMVEEAASTPDEKDLLDAQLKVFLDPEDPDVRVAARRDGIHDDWIEAARRSPVYALAMRYRIALPLHPEYRTMPMVWYVPPLSPVMSTIEGTNSECDPDDVFPAIDTLRIPIAYLANLLSAGDEEVIRNVLKRLAAMRRYMRELNITGEGDTQVAASVGMTPQDIEDMYRLLAIAKYEDRYVIPPAHTELAGKLAEQQGSCGLDFEGGPGSCASTGPTDGYDGEHFHLGGGEPIDLVAIATSASKSVGGDDGPPVAVVAPPTNGAGATNGAAEIPTGNGSNGPLDIVQVRPKDRE